MANRYLVATGNWSDASIWSATSGGAGGAGVPTGSDNVYIDKNYTVTLDADASVNWFNHTNGSFNTSGYAFSSAIGFQSTGSTARTISLSSSVITVGSTNNLDVDFYLDSSGLTFDAGSSLIILDASNYDEGFGSNHFSTGSETFNDVQIKLGDGTTASVVLELSGSPTFRLLDIRSANSAAHTVNFDDNAAIITEKFIGIGSSISSRLLIQPTTETGGATIQPASTSSTTYGQFLDIERVYGDAWQDWAGMPKTACYIGSNSIQDGANNWLLEDPPKISTLVDPLTTAPSSNTNWTVIGTVTQITSGHDGGGYQGSAGASMVSTNSFDLVDSSIIIERPPQTPSNTAGTYFGIPGLHGGFEESLSFYSWIAYGASDVAFYYNHDTSDNGGNDWLTYPNSASKYLKIAVNGTTNTVTMSASSDGVIWATVTTVTIDSQFMPLLRSVRVKGVWDGTSSIGSINPNLRFPLIDAKSATDTGFSGTDPHSSGSSVTYTTQQPLNTGGVTYYWRVRAKDPTGSNKWGPWSSVRQFSTVAISPTVTTASATSISYTSATVGGNVTSDGGASITKRGIVYATTQNPTIANSVVNSPGTTGSFSVNITGLADNTTYYARAYATNAQGTSYGSQVSFKTLQILAPTVTTSTPTSISYTSATVGGNVTASNGATVTERGVVYATTQNPTTANSKAVVGSGTGSFSTSLTLSDNTTYYVRAYAINSKGTSYGTQQSLTTLQITTPTLTTPSVSSITTSSSSVSSSASDNGATVTERGVVYSTSINPTTSDTKVTSGTGTGSFSANLTTLNSFTTYHVRSYAINSKGTSYSSDVSFTTLANTPTVTTGTVGTVHLTTAQINGNSVSANPDSVTINEVGVVYSTSQNPTIANSSVVGSGSPFDISLSALTGKTTYYARAYAKWTGTSTNYAYGSQVSFITQDPPTVTSGSSSSIQPYQATLAGNVTDDNGASITERGFVWGTASNPTVTDNKKTVSGTTGSYSDTITGLTDGTIYHWRAYAVNSKGISYGSDQTFTTLTVTAPTVTTTSVTSITQNSASSGGNVTSANNGTITARGVAYSTSSNPTTSDTTISASGTTGSFTSSLVSLNSNTTYHIRAYATNEKGTSYGSDISFTTLPKPPIVTTGVASGSAIDSFTVSTNTSTNPDSQTINEFGVVYSTSQNPTISDSSKTATGSASSYNVTLTGLTENTTYYVRAYVKWGGTNYAYGSQISYKTQGRPVITLSSPLNNGSTGNLRPQLTFSGVDAENNNITYELQLDTSNAFTSLLLDVYSASDTGFADITNVITDPFTSGDTIGYTLQSDLIRGTNYYWRVRGKDPSGTNSWGNWSSIYKFTVDATTPTVTVSAVSDITFNTANVSGTVTSDGGASVTERGAVYSTSQNPTTSDSKATSGTGTGAFVAALTGLSSSTIYYVRAYAINSKGTSYSAQISFTSQQTPSAPTVVTGSAANTTDTTTEFNGSNVTLDGTQPITEKGVVFSTEANPTTLDRRVIASQVGLGSFNVGITGLTASTTYHARAYAINSIGTGYGDDVIFTTEEPFVPDTGDGYWLWQPSGSDAIIGRTQSTPANSSVNLYLSDLALTNGLDYTLYYSGSTTDNSTPRMVLEWYDGGVKQDQLVTAGTPYTFTYDTSKTLWAIRLFVTDDTAQANDINTTFSNMYLAQESTFSGYVPFVNKGIFEIEVDNNWILDSRREDTIQNVFNAIKGVGWYPFTIDTTGLGWFEVGDQFTITDDAGKNYSVIAWDTSLTIDGGIGETLSADAPSPTDTDYSQAGTITKTLSNTQIKVDKNAETITSLVEDVYDDDGVVNTKFSQIQQNIDSVVTTIQDSGGVNLIKNSVMYAFDDSGVPSIWSLSGSGTLTIQASPESVSAGGISGNAFTLSDETVSQTVSVRKDTSFITQKQYYSFSARVKKNTVGNASITLSNRNETHTITLPDQTSYYWQPVSLEGLLPVDDHFDISITSDSDAQLQVTDVMLCIGQNSLQWTQANGEVMNTSFSVNEDGVIIRSNAFLNDYSKMTALGFEVHKHDSGGDRIFGFNGDETDVAKLKSDQQISMAPLRVVPVNYGTYLGWAFTLTENN